MLKYISISILIYVGVTVSSALSSKIISDNNERIVGGQDAHNGQFKHSVILKTTYESMFCGGFIIADRWVLTAAHCTLHRSDDGIMVYYGSIDRLFDGIMARSDLIVMHEAHNETTTENDIALVRTAQPMIFSNSAGPIELEEAFISSDELATVSGWGMMENESTAARILQWINVKIITNEICKNELINSKDGIVFDSHICASNGVAGQGMCFGDSGSAMTLNNKAIGIVSWGVPCALGSPDVFVRLSFYTKWIQDKISLNT